ncbi:hypothetical protein MUK42_24253 [Musa troglodytarum]|uniref:Uncharacterized protein n=1 Tax=Musa troglodytarum TaxID=320322 RepID=A0A9E7JBU9_9LILI|nr:hypothetical protein MUK42_24253 [Musa troglodytarum]
MMRPTARRGTSPGRSGRATRTGGGGSASRTWTGRPPPS